MEFINGLGTIRMLYGWTQREFSHRSGLSIARTQELEKRSRFRTIEESNRIRTAYKLDEPGVPNQNCIKVPLTLLSEALLALFFDPGVWDLNVSIPIELPTGKTGAICLTPSSLTFVARCTFNSEFYHEEPSMHYTHQFEGSEYTVSIWTADDVAPPWLDILGEYVYYAAQDM